MRTRRTTLAVGAGIATVLCVPLAISVAASASNDVLISRDRDAAASSVRGSTWVAGKVTDSDPASRWASTDGPGTQWVRVDLGGVRTIDRVLLRWDKAYAKTYRVQTSVDGANFTDVYTTRSGDGGNDDLKRLGGSGRFVRVLVTQRGRPAGGYSLAEVKAYGPKAAPLRAVAPVSGSLAAGLDDGRKKETAFELVSSAENSTLDWRGQYGYIEDLRDGRGYTAGIVGFCSGTSDMLELVNEYTRRKPGNVLASYLPALRTVDGSDSHAGLDPGFPAAWKQAARDPIFQKAQEDERDWMYFDPAVRMARTDGLRALGQFAYYDAAVMHGVSGLRGIRVKALHTAKSPADGGDEIAYLDAFLDARADEMRTEEAHRDTTRVDTAQRKFLKSSNLDLTAPLSWKVYGDRYEIAVDPAEK
jgi:chitosanase